MIASNFRIDLGNGEWIDISVQNEKEYTLSDLINDISKAKEWFVFNDTAIQKNHIKRVVQLKEL